MDSCYYRHLLCYRVPRSTSSHHDSFQQISMCSATQHLTFSHGASRAGLLLPALPSTVLSFDPSLASCHRTLLSGWRSSSARKVGRSQLDLERDQMICTEIDLVLPAKHERFPDHCMCSHFNFVTFSSLSVSFCYAECDM